MPTATANGNGGVVTDLYPSPPRNGGGAISTTWQPCNNNNQKLRERMKWSVLILVVISIVFFALFFSVYYIQNVNSTPIIRLESIHVSDFNHNGSFDNSTATVGWLLAFNLDNPNRYASLHYTKLQASVFDKDRRVSWSNMYDVNQSKWQVNELYVEIGGWVMDVQEVRVLSLKLDGVVLIHVKYFRNHWRRLEANCGDIRVRALKILVLNDSLQCDVNLQ